MSRWYENYIGYCFCDGNREVILDDIFYFEDENGNVTGTGYEMHYVGCEHFICDWRAFKQIARQTNLPRR